MGTATQKYSLKWNDFTVNVASTFRDLHSRHDFVDVTLACADGSTLEAHKVILSSVSVYFRDILKTTPCKHPIIILKDTGRDEARALLEFAYTGEVNVAQELLQSFLHMARSFQIKGLDKVECPVDQEKSVPPRPSESIKPDHWPEGGHASRSHTPGSSSSQQDFKSSFSEHFLISEKNDTLSSAPSPIQPSPSLPGSRPSTREPSPVPSLSSSGLGPPLPMSGLNSRTPPPKRWKRSFDLTSEKKSAVKELVPPENCINEQNSEDRHFKRFCESRNNNEDLESIGHRLLPYPHSMPTSPTMFEHKNEVRFTGLVPPGVHGSVPFRGSTPSAPKPDIEPTDTDTNESIMHEISNPLDYRCFNDKKADGSEAMRLVGHNGKHVERPFKMIFRPESAPTVLDMSQDGSALRGVGANEANFRDCVSKVFISSQDGLGRYSCDECGKIFKHPGSLQHHRHIHRGTHRCPSCGKAFSRRWDMERHLNKSKYGCPASRFAAGPEDLTEVHNSST